MRITLSLLAASFVTLAALGARADMAPSPPSLFVEGQAATFTGVPSHATYVLRNVSDQPIDAFLFQVVLAQPWMRVPASIARVIVDGQEVGRTVRVPAHGQVRVEVYFTIDGPIPQNDRVQIELDVQQHAGATQSRPATFQRQRARD